MNAASQVLMDAVEASFPDPHFITMAEVRDSTGHDSGRAADALALGMYRSRGRELWGFEFKVSRADWLCELRQPAKAESWFQFCDRWALVVPAADIAKVDELPVGWGLGLAHKGKVKWLVKPPALSPRMPDRHALCALVYRAQKDVLRDQEQIRQAAEEAGYNRGKAQSEDLVEQLNGWRNSVTAFERATGLNVRHCFHDEESAKALGEAVRSLKEDDYRHLIRRLTTTAEMLREESDDALQKVAKIKAALEAIAAGQMDDVLLPVQAEAGIEAFV